jgi:raffinose/stachyose/melibiose transport system permease protein
MEKVLRDKLAILLFVLPGFLVYTFVVFVPIVWSTVYSLYEGAPGFKFEFVGLVNYGKMWTDKFFLNSFSINMKYVGVVTLSQVFLGFLLALMFEFSIKKYDALVRTIVFFPVVLPVVAIAQLFSKIYEIAPQYGLVNGLLSAIGLESWTQAWIGVSAWALPSLYVMDIWRGMGFYAVIFYAAIVNIPSSIIEAARIDGAKGVSLTRRILVPLMRPVFATSLVLAFTGSFKVFASALALTNGGPGRATQMVTMYMYEAAFMFGDYGYGSAVAVFILAECLLITLIINRFIAQKEASL